MPTVNADPKAETYVESEPLLFGESLVAGYSEDIHILRDISVKAWRGRISCIVGPNGTGKSSLLKALFGFLSPVSGRVVLNGRDITGTPPYRMAGMGVAYLPQRPSLFPFLSVEANLKLGAWHVRTGKAELRDRLELVMERFPVVRDKRKQAAGQLSGGQQRQVEIARSLMTDPPMYLIDGPTAGIDPRTSEDIYKMIQSLARDLDKAVLLVDQDIRSALEITDYLYVVKTGSVLARGPREEFGGDTDALVAKWLYAGGE